MMSRAERTHLGDWWWTVDRAMLVALGVLMVSGLVLLMAGGPPVAERLGLSTFHFVSRQVFYRHFRDGDDAVASAFSRAFTDATGGATGGDARTRILDLFEFAGAHPAMCAVRSSHHTLHRHGRSAGSSYARLKSLTTNPRRSTSCFVSYRWQLQ